MMDAWARRRPVVLALRAAAGWQRDGIHASDRGEYAWSSYSSRNAPWTVTRLVGDDPPDGRQGGEFSVNFG